MAKYIWLFPVLFVFHDLEEIIGFGVWGKKNVTIIEKRMPRVATAYKKMFAQYSMEGVYSGSGDQRNRCTSEYLHCCRQPKDFEF